MITRLSGRGTFNGLPMDVAIARMKTIAEAASLAAERAHARNDDSFGALLAQAVKDKVRGARQQSCFRADASAESNEHSFGESLKKAVEERSGQKQHKERVERERAR